MNRCSATSASTLTALLCGLMLCFTCAQANLEPAPRVIKAELERIMGAPPFKSQHTAYHWRYRGEAQPDTETPSGFWNFLAGLSGLLGSVAELLLWLVVVGLIAAIIVYRDRWLGLFSRVSIETPVRLPTALFGRDEVIEPLPADVPGAAWKLWCDGHKRACLSTLYRGAVLNMVVRRRIELPDSATEEDCLRITRGLDAPALTDYFGLLTRSWQRVAYAAVMPEEAHAKLLCDGWREHFEAD